MIGITFEENFLDDPESLFEHLKENAPWDESMFARKTCSYGVAYNYSQMSYPYREIDPIVGKVASKVAGKLGFEPNNCLVNYYLNGKSKMGFHSDQTDILYPQTGVAIVSIGETRVLRFRKIDDHDFRHDYSLNSGSLIHMTNELQKEWQHSIPKANTENGRMSLTFRKIRE
jgi:alkylated DNA repair dioxygenase AlkB